MRLSTMFDCWKKSCQGATVVPTRAMISSTAVESRPPWMPGTNVSWATWLQCGWAYTSSGSTSRLPATNTNIMRSHFWKLPVMVIRTRSSAATGTEAYLLTPRYSSANATPMNSVTMVRKLRMKRSITENAPQKRPNRSRIRRAWPTRVTAPSRTTISWLTISTGISSSSTQSRLVP